MPTVYDYHILDNLLEGCQIIDFDWRYAYCNDRAAGYAQQAKETLLGSTMMECYPGVETTALFALLQRCMIERTIGNIENEVFYPDGSSAWFELKAMPVPTGLMIFSVDITARKQAEAFCAGQDIAAHNLAEEALKQYAQQLEILHEIDLGILNANSIAEIMTGALKQIRLLFACEQAAALLFDLTENEVLILAMESTAPSVIKEGDRYPMSPGFLEGVDAQQVSMIQDLEILPATSNAYRRVRQDGMRSSLRALFSYHGGPLGMIVLNAATPHYFTAEQQSMAAQIANQLTVALQQRQLVDDLARHVVTVEESQHFLRSTLDAFPANTAVLAPDGVILMVNQRWKVFAETTGAPVDNHYLGINYLTICDMAVGPATAEAAATATGIRAVIAGEQDEFSLEYLCSTDPERWFLLRVTPLAEALPRRAIVAHIDITERKAAEKAEREQRLLAEALRDSLAALTASVDTETTLQQILTHSATVIPSEAGTILLYEGNHGRVAYLRGHSAEAEAFFRMNQVSLESGIYAKSVGAPGYYIVEDTATEPGWHTFPATAWVRSSLAVQIVVRGEPIGLLIADSGTVGQFQPKDVANLQAFARYAALALEKAQYVNQLETLVRLRTAELQAAKERVEAILQNSADGILLIDPKLRIQQANLSFYHLVGCVPTECDNKTLHDFIAVTDIELITQLIQSVIADTKTATVEFHAQRLDGASFDAELSVGLINDNGLVCILRDITERKAQERALRYHASLQKAVGDAVIVTDMATRIQSWNQAAERIYGWSTDEAIGQSAASVLQTQFASPDERAYYMAQLQSQGWWQAEVIQRHREGHLLHILSSATLVYDTQGAPIGIVAVNHDITERKLAEDALQKAAAEIFELYNNAPCGYHSLDQDGVVVEINDTELRWLGYSRAEVVGKRRLLDFLTAESQLIFHQNFPLFKARGWMEDLQYEFVCKSGATFPVLLSSKARYDEQGRFLASHSSVFDITALKQAQQALTESEARYRLLAENVTDTLMKINADGVRTFVTPSCYNLLGYAPDELIGQDSFAIVHPDDLPGVQNTIHQALVSGQLSFLITQRLRHKAGYYCWVEATNSIIRDPGSGDLVEIMAVARDITARKRAEALLQVRIEEDHEFQEYLRALHEITIELTQLEEMDAFYHRTVELGLRYFKLDRLALFIYEPESGFACGVYGTDPHGQVTDEQHIRFQPTSDGILHLAFTSVERFGFRENVPLYHNHGLIGYGWNVATILWNGAERLGWLVADNLITQKPASKPMLDILRLYALTVGTLLAQKQAQAALRRSEQRYRLLAENISDVVVETTPDAEFLYVSPSCQTVLGYEPVDLMGQIALDYMHPDDLPLAKHAFLSTQTVDHHVATMVVRFRHQDGRYFWLETMIRAIRTEKTETITKYIGSARDISDRKAAELALQESEANYRLLVETMRSGLLVYDAEDRLTYVNDRACEMVGYARAEMVGTRPYDSLNDEAAQKVKTHLVEKRGQEVAPYEILTYHQNGAPLHFLISGNPLFDKEGDYRGSLLVITDITVQKQAEEALRQALEKEKELGELKSRFISMASHEFRTPLATILALTETINAYRHKLSDAQIQQRLARIMEQVDHLKDIMEDVLLLAQMQARRAQFNPVAQDLDALCCTLVEEFQGRADVKHQLIYHAAPGDYTIQLDPKLMRQIISNLLSNAIKYSPPQKPVQIMLTHQENQCFLQVRDEGIGIPPADLPHLFQPFHRASNVGTIAGTGLGLVITKEAIELHNGVITVESQVGQGTTFTMMNHP